jgi:hypothetical protein
MGPLMRPPPWLSHCRAAGYPCSDQTSRPRGAITVCMCKVGRVRSQRHSSNYPQRQPLVCTWRPGFPSMSYMDHIPMVPCQRPSLPHNNSSHTQHMVQWKSRRRQVCMRCMRRCWCGNVRCNQELQVWWTYNKRSQSSLRPAGQEVAPGFVCRQCAVRRLVLSRHGSRRAWQHELPCYHSAVQPTESGIAEGCWPAAGIETVR